MTSRAVLHSLFGLTALSLIACSPKDQPAATVPAVYVTEAIPAQSTQNRTFPAILRARVESELGFRVAGQIAIRHVGQGTSVKKGEVLAELGNADYRLALEAARQQLQAAEVDAQQSRQDAERFERLAADNSVGRADAKRQRARADAAHARWEQARQQWALEGNRLEQARLKAPFDGVVTAVRAEVGQVVPVGLPIFALAKTGDVEAWVDVPEHLIPDIRSLKASVELVDAPNVTPVPAVLREVSAAAQAPGRTFRVRYGLTQLPTSWKLGRSVTVMLSGMGTEPSQAQSPAVELPVTALVNQGGATQVWLVDSSTGQLRAQPVQVTQQSQNRAVVQGVPVGAQVVSAGAHKLDASMKVRPVVRPAAAATQGGVQ